MTAPGERRVVYMPLDEVARAPRNPKLHAEHVIAAGIDQFGLVDLPVVDDRTGRLVSGHGRLDDLLRRRDAGEPPPGGVEVDPDGTWRMATIRGWASHDDAHAEAAVVLLNNATTLGGWDQHTLAELLGDLEATDTALLLLTGNTEDDLDDLRKLLEPPDLDQLGKELGDPDPADTWPIVRAKVAPHIAAAWRSHLDTHSQDDNAAMAALLEVDPEAPEPSDWTP